MISAESVSKYPLTTHSRPETLASRSRPMVGSATLMTVLSRKTRADPSTVTVRTQRPSLDDTRIPSPPIVSEYPLTPDGQRDAATTILGLMATEAEQTVADVMLRHPKTLPAEVTVAEARASLGKGSVKMV